MPETEMVVVDRDHPGRFGNVLSQQGPRRFEVEWIEGGTESVDTNARFVRTRRGGLQHLASVDPSEIPRLFAERDGAVLLFQLALVHPQPKTRTGQDIRKVLEDLGLDRDLVKKRWNTVRAAFEEHPDVQKGAESVPRYRWVGESLPTAPIPARQPQPDGTTHVDVPPAKSAGVRNSPRDEAEPSDGPHPTRNGTETQPSKPRPQRPRRHPDSTRTPHPIPVESAAPIDPAPEHETPAGQVSQNETAHQRLARKVLSKDAPSAELIVEVSRHPIWTDLPEGVSKKAFSSALGTLDEAELTRLAPALFLSPGWNPDALRVWYTSQDCERGIAAAVVQLSRLRTDKHATASGLVASALSLALTSGAVWNAPLEASARLLSELGHHQGLARNTADQLTQTLGVQVRRGVLTVASFQRVALLQRGLAQLPLRPDAGRVSFLAALYSSEPETAVDAAWWTGLDAATAVALSDSAVHKAITDPRVAGRYLPELRSMLSGVTTRRAILPYLASALVVDVLPEAELVTHLRRVAESDRPLRGWIESLSRADEVAKLSSEANALRAELTTAQENASKLGAERDRLQHTVEELLTQLESLATDRSELRDSQRRQAELDAMRGLAQVVAAVEADAASLDADQLVQRVQRLGRRRGLFPIGHRGETVAFDPSEHEAPGERPKNGVEVSVSRSGYKWVTGQGETVLVKAVVY